MPRTVLVADDNLTIQRMASEMLASDGVEVVTVANGMAAIKKLPDAKPLVILADVDMPGKDGYEVCDFVKNTPELHYVRVLLAVSDADPYDQLRGDRVHADGIVKKPFEREQLVSMVTECLNQAEAQRPAIAEPLPRATPVAGSESSVSQSEVDPQQAGPVEPVLAVGDPPQTEDRLDKPVSDFAKEITDTAQPVAGLDVKTGAETAQFPASTPFFEPIGEAPTGEDVPAAEPSWSASQFSSVVDFAAPQRAEPEDANPAPAFEPLAPFSTQSETWADDSAWSPLADEPPSQAAHQTEPEHPSSSFTPPLEPMAARPLDSEMPPAVESGARQSEGLGTALGDESRYEQLVESMLVDGSAAKPTSPLPETQDHKQPVQPDVSVPSLSPPEGIEWEELERAAEARMALDADTVAQIVRSVVGKMAPPALAPDALHELETRITADLLSELKLS
ncbi:MAG TPA: response regulator [Terriglobia bacterium]|nr:response regulator [Terriglobia bacterium]